MILADFATRVPIKWVLIEGSAAAAVPELRREVCRGLPEDLPPTAAQRGPVPGSTKDIYKSTGKIKLNSPL